MFTATVSRINLSANFHLLFVRVLDDNKQVFLVGSNHDFVLLGANTEKGEVVLGIQITDNGTGFCSKLSNKRTVLDSQGIVQGCSDGDSFIIDNNNSLDSLVT